MSVTSPTLMSELAFGWDCLAVAVVAAMATIATIGEQRRREALVGIQWELLLERVDGAHATGRANGAHS